VAASSWVSFSGRHSALFFHGASGPPARVAPPANRQNGVDPVHRRALRAMTRADPRHARAANLLVKEFFAGSLGFHRPGRLRARDAIRGVTLLDAEPADLKFWKDDYRDSTRFDCQAALTWLAGHAPAAPSARRRAAVEAVLAVLKQNDARRGKHRRSPSRALQGLLEAWPEVEVARVVALCFAVGLFRSPAEPDGPLWYSGRRSDLRFHVPTALRLFPAIALDADASSVRVPPPRTR